MSIEICQKKCLGCTHEGYLCRQFRHLQEREIPQDLAENGTYKRCPSCNANFTSEFLSKYQVRYCPYCGQRIQGVE